MPESVVKPYLALKRFVFESALGNTIAAAVTCPAAGAAVGFLTFEITDTSESPAKLVLTNITHTVSFYVLLVIIAMTIWYHTVKRQYRTDVLRFNDPAYLRALLTKAAMDAFVERTPAMIERGEIKDLQEVLDILRQRDR